MARLVGIDIRATQLRAVVLRTGYRQTVVEATTDLDRASFDSLEAALAAVVRPFDSRADAVAVALDGEHAFIRRIKLPKTAVKQLGEILPFEVEAQVPVDLGELLFDYRLLDAPEAESLDTIVAAARTEQVSALLELVRAGVGQEPERIGCGALPLANLARVCEPLRAEGPLGVLDLGVESSEVLVLSKGQPLFARSLSCGTAGLPESAPKLAAQLRQTFAAHGGAPISELVLVGGGVEALGAEAYLAYELGVAVRVMPPPELPVGEGVVRDELPRHAKALSLALSLAHRSGQLELRQGPLAFQRGLGFVKQKAPLLAGLLAAILISFAFSTWAELRGLDKENEILSEQLGSLTETVLGSSVSDPALASELLSRQLQTDEPDPMPKKDAFDVIVDLSNVVPETVVHDVEEFDMQRGHVRVTGVVDTTGDAQKIATALGKKTCLDDAKISKVTQVINGNRQKYILELDVRCEEDKPKKKPNANETEDAQ